MMSETYRGSCLCGAVRYEISGPIDSVTHCHCTMCRKAHGAAFATYATVKQERHRFVQGRETLRDYRSSNSVTRTFCSNCGSPMTWSDPVRFVGNMSFPLGSLDTPYVPPKQQHIYVASKAPWHVIGDDWPQSAGT
jgi:hypothetical protein